MIEHLRKNGKRSHNEVAERQRGIYKSVKPRFHVHTLKLNTAITKCITNIMRVRDNVTDRTANEMRIGRRKAVNTL